MGGKNNAARLLAGLICIGGVSGWIVAFGGTPELAVSWRSKVSGSLLSIYDARDRLAGVHKQSAGVDRAALGPRFNDQGAVQADIYYDCDGDAPVRALATAGFAVGLSVKLTPFCVVEGWVAPQSLAQVAGLAAVSRMALPSYALRPRSRFDVEAQPASSPVAGIDANGLKIMHADQFVSQTGTGGGGVTVGVQSAGVSSISTIQARGEVPAVRMVRPADGAAAPAGDEGTALLEEVHAVAPSAGLAYCGPGTFVEYTSCLSQLIAAGATILVDDIIFPEQDLLASNSSQVQGIEQLITANPNVVLFTAGGNYNGSYWEGDYTPVSLASQSLQPLKCPASGGQTDSYVTQFGADPSQVLTVTASSSVPIALAWADPPDTNASKFDLYWVNSADSTKSGCLPTAAATDNQVTQNVNLSPGTYTLYIGTPDAASAGKFVKMWIGGDGLTSISKPTPGAIVTPQAFASGAVTVGAVNGSDGVGNNIESFSSVGPITVVFPALAHIQSPILVAPDGINVDAAGTYFSGELFPDGNFYGTSASAPNAGAVAALIRGAFPSLNAAQLIAALQAGAVRLGSSLPDPTFGYGRVDAMGTLATFPAPTITALPDSSVNAGASTAALPFTVSGFGPLHFKVSSSNASAIPAAVVSAGTPGVTIAPGDCGTSTLTCTATVMAANGPGGTVSVTLSALDGANRSAAAPMTVTVAGNQSAPTPPSGSGGGGGFLDWWLLGPLAMLMARKRIFPTRYRADGRADLASRTPVSARAKPMNCTGDNVSWNSM